MNILCTICAREGSKEVKNKNIKLINKKPLIYYTIKQAINSKLFDEIVVSTDSIKISNLSKKFGANSFFIRPKIISNDRAPKILAIQHALIKSERYYDKKYDFVVDLDVTSPLRNILDIKKSLYKLINSSSNNLVTVCKAKKNPYFNMYEYKNNILKKAKTNNNKFLRRQDAPVIYENNASIYIWRKDFLLKTKKVLNNKTIFYEMPADRSIDIDSIFDFKLVKCIIEKGLNNV